MNKFKVISEFTPKGDQPAAIKKLKNGIDNNIDFQTLMGITGSGKGTFMKLLEWYLNNIPTNIDTCNGKRDKHWQTF